MFIPRGKLKPGSSEPADSPGGISILTDYFLSKFVYRRKHPVRLTLRNRVLLQYVVVLLSMHV